MSERRGAGGGRRRRVWKRIALGSLIFAVAAVVALVLARDAIISAVLPSILGSALGLEVTIDDVDTTLGGHVTLRGIRGSDPEDWAVVRTLAAESVSVELALGALFGEDGLPVDLVRARGLRLEIDTDRRGSPEKSSGSAGGSSGFPWPARLPRVEVEDSRVAIRRSDQSALFEDVAAKIAPAEDGSRVIARGRTEWSAAGEEGAFPWRVEGLYKAGTVSDVKLVLSDRETLTDGAIDLSTFDLDATLALGGGEVGVELRDVRSESPALRVRADSVALGGVPALIGLERSPIEGSFSLETEIELDRQALLDSTASFSLLLEGGSWLGRPVPRLALSAQYAKQILTAERIELDDPTTLLVGRSVRVRIGPDEIEPLDGELRVDSTDLASTFQAFVPEVPAIEELESPALEARLRVRGRALRIDSLRLDTVLGSVAISDGRIDEIDLNAIAATTGAAEIHVTVPELASWRPILAARNVALEPQGGVEIRAGVRRRESGLSVDATVEGRSLAMGEQAIGDVHAVLRYENERLVLPSFDFDSNDPSPLSISAVASAEIGDLLERAPLVLRNIELEATLRGSDLDRRVASFAPDFAENVPAGGYESRIQVSGEPSWPDVAFSLDVEPLAISFEKRDERLAVDARNVAIGETRVSTSIESTIARDFSSGTGTIEALYVVQSGNAWSNVTRSEWRFDREKHLLALSPGLELIGDGASIVLRLEPTASFEDAGRRVFIEANAPGEVPLPGSGDALDIAGIEARFALDYERSPWLDLESWIPGRAIGRARLRRGAAAAGGVGAELGNVSLGVEWGGRGESGHVALAVADIDLSLANGEENAPKRNVLENARISSRVLLSGSKLEIERFLIESEPLRLAIGGGLEAEDANAMVVLLRDGAAARAFADVSFDLRVDSLASFRPLVPGARRIDGSFWTLGTIRGPLAAPSVTARFGVDKGGARIGDLPPINALELRGAMHGERIVLENLQAELGGAPIRAEGLLADIGGSPRAELELEGENALLVRSDAARMRGDLDLHAAGPLTRLELGGRVDLTSGRILGELPLFDVLRATARRMRGAASRAFESGVDTAAQRAASIRLFSLREEPLSDLQFDVAVHSKEPLELRGNLFRGKLRPEVRLLGTGRLPYLAGAVYLDDFVIELPATRLRVDAGVVRFEERQGLRPQIEMTGTTRIYGYDVTVAVSGPIDEPTITLASSPPLPSDDLFVLLVTGRLPNETGEAAREKALVTVAKYFGLDLLRQIFGNEDIESGESLLDRFEIEVGRNLSRSGRETLEVRFRITDDLVFDDDSLYLTGERDEYDHYNAGLRLVIQGD